MKAYFTLPAILLVSIMATAQQPVMVANPFPKTITVTGSAEMDVIPDEIYVHVFLREYQKKGEAKKSIETIKSEFLNSVNAAGIADSAVSIASYTGFNDYNWVRRKRKDPNLMSTIVYQVKFKNSDLMDALVDRLDDEATQNFMIVNVGHSKIAEYRKQLKIAAVKAAREKALYLTTAIDEKLGHAITISEPMEPQFNPRVSNPNLYGYSTRGANTQLDGFEVSKESIQTVEFRKMKLKFDVVVIYALE